MGLDSVELVMRVEETFDIAIPDDGVETIETVNDLVDTVFARVEHTPVAVCRTQRAFHRIRRGLQENLSTERRLIRPDTPLEALIPRERRLGVWPKLMAAAGTQTWPELRRSDQDRVVIGSLVAASTVVAAVWASGGVAVVAAIGSTGLLLAATAHRRVNFRPDVATVGQLAEHVGPDLPADLRPRGGRWTREEVRAAVRAIIVDQLNVDPSFSDDASFVDDLGLS